MHVSSSHLSHLGLVTVGSILDRSVDWDLCVNFSVQHTGLQGKMGCF